MARLKVTGIRRAKEINPRVPQEKELKEKGKAKRARELRVKELRATRQEEAERAVKQREAKMISVLIVGRLSQHIPGESGVKALMSAESVESCPRITQRAESSALDRTASTLPPRLFKATSLKQQLLPHRRQLGKVERI
jgi:hypothetical protein